MYGGHQALTEVAAPQKVDKVEIEEAGCALERFQCVLLPAWFAHHLPEMEAAQGDVLFFLRAVNVYRLDLMGGFNVDTPGCCPRRGGHCLDWVARG